jgi:hypothetical protein
MYDTTTGDTKGTLIKITPNTPSDTNYFRKNTFVNLYKNNENYKTLIVDLVPNEYFVIETYKSKSFLEAEIEIGFDIKTIYNLLDVSNILYDVYINNSKSYYRVRDDDKRRAICNAYGDFISQDVNVIINVTAFLTQDEKHKFVLKVYDPENFQNGGVVRLPTVSTNPINTINGSSSTTLNGEVLDTGGAILRERGFCCSINSMPTILDTTITLPIISGSSGVGLYSCDIVGLNPSTIYYYRAYAKNDTGTGYGLQYTFTTGDPVYAPPIVKTLGITSSSHWINVSGNVLDIGYRPITMRGIVYSTGTTIPYTGTTDYIVYLPESGDIGTFNCTITGLTNLTQYSYNTFAINSSGTSYGESGTTYTLDNLPPVVTTNGISNISYSGFTIGGTLVSDDGEAVTELGMCLSTSFNPTTGDTKFTYSFGSYTLPYIYSVNVTGLTESTTYHIRAYSINPNFVSYGGNVTINTTASPVKPTVIISGLTSFNHTGATISSNVTSDGGDSLIARGLYYSTSTPTTGDTYISSLVLTPSNWISTLTGLTSGITYYAMASAVNNFGTGYSSVFSFTTASLPIVALNSASPSSTTAVLQGEIISDGNKTILSRGFIYDLTPVPSGNTTLNGSGTGTWLDTLTGLTPTSLYYAAAYATNEIGTSYSTGTTTGFTTTILVSVPTFDILSPVFTNQTSTTIDITSNILSDNNGTILSRGIYYGTSPNPSVNSILDSSPTIGSYIITLTGLSTSTVYYIKSFATNSAGMSTIEKSFDTYITNDTTVLGQVVKDNTITTPTTLFEMGRNYELWANVNITLNSTPLSQAWSGYTTSGFTLGSQTDTIMNWTSGITVYDNYKAPATPYLSIPLDSSTWSRYFVFNESCGIPSTIKTHSVRLESIYPYLTNNRVPISITTINSMIEKWCSDGSFYSGNFVPPNNVDMNKVVQLSGLTFEYNYEITSGDAGPTNMIFYASPSTYGDIKSIIDGNTLLEITPTKYLNQSLASIGLAPSGVDWTIPYNVYIFTVPIANVTITYNY